MSFYAICKPLETICVSLTRQEIKAGIILVSSCQFVDFFLGYNETWISMKPCVAHIHESRSRVGRGMFIWLSCDNKVTAEDVRRC